MIIRIQEDSNLDDLELMKPKQVEEHVRALEKKVAKRIEQSNYAKEENPKHLLREKSNYIYRKNIAHICGKYYTRK